MSKTLKLGLIAALIIGSGPALVQATPSSANLVAHWSYDQSSGTTLTDNSGNAHTGTFASTPTWSAGKINNGLTLDGSDNVALGNITQINNVGKATLAAWVKRSAAGAMVHVGKQASNQDFGIEAYSDGKLYFNASKGSTAFGTITLNDTAWHHVAMVFDGAQTGNANRLKGYVDGVQKTLAFSGTVGTTTTNSTTAFNIGMMSGEHSNGQVDDTWLYARALSLAEVQDLAQVVTDTVAPSVPTSLSATAASQSQITLAWTASTDNVAVTGYRVFRNGVQVGTSSTTSYQDTGLAASTAYSYTVRAYDAATNVSGDSNTASATTLAPPPVPTAAITATPGAVASGGSSTLDWTSTDATTCTASGAWSGSKATAGSQVVSGIVANSTYTLTCNGAGGQAVASAAVSVLPACSDGLDNDGDTLIDFPNDPGCTSAADANETDPDTTVPTVSVTSPLDGATVSGVVSLTATAADNVAVGDVVFSVDGTQLGSPDTSSPYGVSLDTTTLVNGSHIVRATAHDTSGNSAFAEITVTVDNQAPPVDVLPPTVGFTSPTEGATVSGNVSLAANASDNVGVVGVKFYANGVLIGSEDTSSPYGLTWSSTGVSNGSVQLTAVARDAAGNTNTTAVNVTVNNVATYKYITGVSANGRYFVDQTGAPILVKADGIWSLFSNVGQSDVELWAASRESHGFNAAIISIIAGPGNGGNTNGSTFDGILPFTGGNPATPNEAYWSRMDSYMTTMKNHGITVIMYPMDGWNTLTGGAFAGKSTSSVYAYGQFISNRYNAASYPNVIWNVGGDYDGWSNTINAQFTNLYNGIRSTGDTRLFSTQLNNESLTTDVATYEALAQWNFVYTYAPTYYRVLNGYNRASSTRDPRPSLFGEGNYENENWYGGLPTTDETLRRQQLWALTSGSPGEILGTSDWQFNTGWQSRLDSVWIQQASKNRAWFQSLVGWHLLVPDNATGVAQIVTAGRGVKITTDQWLDVRDNDYVTASQTPDHSLTVVYVPTAVSNTNARTITLSLSQPPASYTATWVDPTDATSTQSAVIDGSGNVTTPGLHSDGTRDWLLVIR